MEPARLVKEPSKVMLTLGSNVVVTGRPVVVPAADTVSKEAVLADVDLPMPSDLALAAAAGEDAAGVRSLSTQGKANASFSLWRLTLDMGRVDVPVRNGLWESVTNNCGCLTAPTLRDACCSMVH